MGISLVLFDCFEDRNNLLPLVATRPIGNLRVGALTLDQKWSSILQSEVSFLTEDYLSIKYPLSPQDSEVLVLRSTVLPDSNLVQTIKSLKSNERLVDKKGKWIAFLSPSHSKEALIAEAVISSFTTIIYENKYQILHQLEDIFICNEEQIAFDTQFFSPLKKSDVGNNSFWKGNKLFIDDSAIIADTVHIDSTKGAVIILENAVIEAGCVLHGPAVIGKGSRVKAGTVIYPNVTVGDFSTVCGELNNTVIWGNSSKGHYGYLGCAVLGEGCNLGAGTSNSNLKNDWNTVQLYSYADNNFRNTGLLKCGVFIGDHSMLGISSKITTGTVIGVGTQIAMSNFIPNFVRDFSWLTDTKDENYIFTKFVEMLARKAQVKGETFTALDKEILHYIYSKNIS